MMRRSVRARVLTALPLLIVMAGCVAPAPKLEPPPPTLPPEPVVDIVRPPARAEIILQGSAEQGAAMTGRVPDGTRTLTLDGRSVPFALNGGFMIAFDRDAEASASLVATLADGRLVERRLNVAPGVWRIEHVNTPWRGSASSDAEFQRRRPAELEQIAAARAVPVDADGWRQTFIWPVKGRFSGFFGSQRVYQGKPGSYHSGTDIAVPAGTPFVAPADGVVTLAATTPFTLEGYLLIVDHGMGLSSAFLHCQRLDVKVGDRVVQGQQLGTVGATGRATGPHMHWGLKWHDARLDPGKLAGPMGG